MTDFWRDLQAWTQAQYDARARAAGLRRNNLAADINKLLRDRLSYRLTIKDGTAIGAEFLRTAGRIPPLVPLVPLPMESGWLTFEDRGSGELPYVYTHSPTGLTTYTIVPDGITLDGYASYQSELTRASYTPIKAYDPVNSALARHRPERYSGLTRLFVQALYGANRTIDEVLTGLDALVPSRAVAFWMGLIRSPDGEYWLVWLNRRSYLGGLYQSIRARHLNIPAAMADVATAVRGWSGNMSAADANYLEAYLLSTLEYDASATNVILIPEGTSDLNNMYSTYWTPMPWGLCFRYQMRGATDEHTCGMVWTARHQSSFNSGSSYIYFQNFRRAFLDITFTAGVPSATFTAVETDRTEFNTLRGPIRVYWTDLTTLNEAFTPSNYGIDEQAALAAVTMASWYGSDGNLHEIDFYRDSDQSLINDNYPDPADCGYPSTLYGYHTQYTYALAGFSLDGVEIFPDDRYRGLRDIETNITLSQTGSGVDVTIGDPGHLNDACSLAGGFVTGTTYSVAEYYADFDLSGLKTDYTRRECQSALILSDVPGVAWVIVIGNPNSVLATETYGGTFTAWYKEEWTAISGPGTSFDAYYPSSPSPTVTGSTSSDATEAHNEFIACINDTSWSESGAADVAEIISWLGTTDASWDWRLGTPGFTQSLAVLDYQPAICGYNAVREMFGDGLGDAFDARGYTFLGRLIGGA